MQGYGAGAVDYLSKPCNPAILRSKVAVFVNLFCKNRALEAEIAERRQAEQRLLESEKKGRELNEAARPARQRSGGRQLGVGGLQLFGQPRPAGALRQVAGFVGRMQKLDREGADANAAEQYLPLIQNSVTRMGRLIDDLLEFSRIGRGEYTIRTSASIACSTRRCKSRSRKRQVMRSSGESNRSPEVRGDPSMLRQVFANLIDNAMKFARPRDPAEIEIGSLPAEKEHVVFVRDNGVGFNPRYAHKLFGVFQRLHSAAEFDGTGIGLATVRRIIRARTAGTPGPKAPWAVARHSASPFRVEANMDHLATKSVQTNGQRRWPASSWLRMIRTTWC